MVCLSRYKKRYTAEEIDQIVRRFNEDSLPKAQWTHHAHLIVAFWYNATYPNFEEAFQLVKAKIISYNEAVGTPNTKDAGYHETITRFWMIITKNFSLDYPHIELALNEFLKTPASYKRHPLRFYSRHRLYSADARQQFLTGDLKLVQLLSSTH